MPRKRLSDVAVVAVALVLVALLGALRASQNAAATSVPSTHDTGAAGYAALYDFLSRERVAVERFEFPVAELRSARGTLVLAGNGALDSAAPAKDSLQVLDEWVRRGGRLVVLDGGISASARRILGLPKRRDFLKRTGATAGCGLVPALRGAPLAGSFAGGYAAGCSKNSAALVLSGDAAPGVLLARGRGSIALFATPGVFDNLALAQRNNARLAYAVFDDGPVRFDERIYGYAAGRTFWEVVPWAMRAAAAIAIAAVVLAVAGANLPFAPPYAADPPDERDSSAYVDSLASMLARGGASREAVKRIAERCAQVLQPRAGGDERARMLLRELRTLEATPRPGTDDLLAAGRIFARVRKDYGC